MPDASTQTAESGPQYGYLYTRAVRGGTEERHVTAPSLPEAQEQLGPGNWRLYYTNDYGVIPVFDGRNPNRDAALSRAILLRQHAIAERLEKATGVLDTMRAFRDIPAQAAVAISQMTMAAQWITTLMDSRSDM